MKLLYYSTKVNKPILCYMKLMFYNFGSKLIIKSKHSSHSINNNLTKIPQKLMFSSNNSKTNESSLLLKDIIENLNDLTEKYKLLNEKDKKSFISEFNIKENIKLLMNEYKLIEDTNLQEKLLNVLIKFNYIKGNEEEIFYFCNLLSNQVHLSSVSIILKTVSLIKQHNSEYFNNNKKAFISLYSKIKEILSNTNLANFTTSEVISTLRTISFNDELIQLSPETIDKFSKSLSNQSKLNNFESHDLSIIFSSFLTLSNIELDQIFPFIEEIMIRLTFEKQIDETKLLDLDSLVIIFQTLASKQYVNIVLLKRLMFRLNEITERKNKEKFHINLSYQKLIILMKDLVDLNAMDKSLFVLMYTDFIKKFKLEPKEERKVSSLILLFNTFIVFNRKIMLNELSIKNDKNKILFNKYKVIRELFLDEMIPLFLEHKDSIKFQIGVHIIKSLLIAKIYKKRILKKLLVYCLELIKISQTQVISEELFDELIFCSLQLFHKNKMKLQIRDLLKSLNIDTDKYAFYLNNLIEKTEKSGKISDSDDESEDEQEPEYVDERRKLNNNNNFKDQTQ